MIPKPYHHPEAMITLSLSYLEPFLLMPDPIIILHNTRIVAGCFDYS
jgi:hypothetical protein